MCLLHMVRLKKEARAGHAALTVFYDPDLTDQPDFIDQTAFEVVVVGGCGVVVVCLSEER